MKDIPVVELKDLDDTLKRISGSSVDPQRPFDGQDHTEQGERGKTKVTLRMRDIADCFVIGMALSSGPGRAYERASNGTINRNDLYEIELDAVDPLAVMQNMLCEIERRLGIFPNLPGNKELMQ